MGPEIQGQDTHGFPQVIVVDREDSLPLDVVARALGSNLDHVGGVRHISAVFELLEATAIQIDMFVISPWWADVDAIQMAELIVSRSPATSVVLVRDDKWRGDVTAAMQGGIHEVVGLSGTTESLAEGLMLGLERAARLRRVGLKSGERDLRATRRAFVRDLAEQGVSPAEIGQLLGINEARVRQLLRDEPPPATDEDG